MKLILIFLFAILASVANAQVKVKLDAQGNYTQIKDTTKQEIKGTPTGKKYTDSKGISYDVYQSSKGSLFVIRVSKNGNQYKQYLKE